MWTGEDPEPRDDTAAGTTTHPGQSEVTASQPQWGTGPTMLASRSRFSSWNSDTQGRYTKHGNIGYVNSTQVVDNESSRGI